MELQAAKEQLDGSRPTAVNLSWATSRLVELCHHMASAGYGVAQIKEKILEEAQELAEDVRSKPC